MKSYSSWYMILGIIPNYEELYILVYDSRNNPQL
jgi:hypothetical protein